MGNQIKKQEGFEPSDIIIPPDFYTISDRDHRLLYSDTDSAYMLTALDFNKLDDMHKTVDVVQGIAKRIGNAYSFLLNDLSKLIGFDIEYNNMNFKTEIIAQRGFFIGKKMNALAVFWDEGKFFTGDPYIKKTGGAIKKSDTTKISEAMLTKIYDVMLDVNKTDLRELCYDIFKNIGESYKALTIQAAKQGHYHLFGIPQKWGQSAKRETAQVQGGKLYNTVITDTFRPSDSFIVLKIILNKSKLLKFIPKNTNEFQYSVKDINRMGSKIKTISIPSDLPEADRITLSDRLLERGIELNINEIIAFNITKKTDTFLRFFDDSIKRQVL
jgi:hypothetical protein